MSRKWIKAAGVRAAKTAAQMALSMITVGQLFHEVNWASVISVSVVAAIYSVLMSVKGLPEVDQNEE